MDNIAGFPYDPADKESIYLYAIDLRGSTLREKTNAEQISDIHKNKGSFGSAVETYYFMLDLNNESEADFKEAGLELKTTPLKRNKDGSLKAKTSHTLNKVPFTIYDNVTDGKLSLKEGDWGLSNIAATTANLLGLEKHEAWDDSMLVIK